MPDAGFQAVHGCTRPQLPRHSRQPAASLSFQCPRSSKIPSWKHEVFLSRPSAAHSPFRHQGYPATPGLVSASPVGTSEWPETTLCCQGSHIYKEDGRAITLQSKASLLIRQQTSSHTGACWQGVRRAATNRQVTLPSASGPLRGLTQLPLVREHGLGGESLALWGGGGYTERAE